MSTGWDRVRVRQQEEEKEEEPLHSEEVVEPVVVTVVEDKPPASSEVKVETQHVEVLVDPEPAKQADEDEKLREKESEAQRLLEERRRKEAAKRRKEARKRMELKEIADIRRLQTEVYTLFINLYITYTDIHFTIWRWMDSPRSQLR